MPLQASVWVQKSPSSQGSVLLGLLQPAPTVQISSVQTLLSEQSALSAVPLQMPPEQISFWVHATASSQGAVLLGWVHVPDPLQMSFVQTLPSSVQTVPLRLKQLSAVSLQPLLHTNPPVQGSPVWVEQVPPVQVSVPLQNMESVQADPFVSAKVQLSAVSLQDSAQLPSPSGPGQGSPVWVEQVPPVQVSVPLQ
jgi:hypothetical protein